MVRDTSLLNTQQYKVLSRVKLSNLGKGVAPSLHLGVVAIEKGAFWSPSTMATNLLYMCVCVYVLLLDSSSSFKHVW